MQPSISTLEITQEDKLKQEDHNFSLKSDLKSSSYKRWLRCLTELCEILKEKHNFKELFIYSRKCIAIMENSLLFPEGDKDDEDYRNLCRVRYLFPFSVESSEQVSAIMESKIEILKIKVNKIKYRTSTDKMDIESERSFVLNSELIFHSREKYNKAFEAFKSENYDSCIRQCVGSIMNLEFILEEILVNNPAEKVVLGISICKEIVNYHQLLIEVYSKNQEADKVKFHQQKIIKTNTIRDRLNTALTLKQFLTEDKADTPQPSDKELQQQALLDEIKKITIFMDDTAEPYKKFIDLRDSIKQKAQVDSEFIKKIEGVCNLIETAYQELKQTAETRQKIQKDLLAPKAKLKNITAFIPGYKQFIKDKERFLKDLQNAVEKLNQLDHERDQKIKADQEKLDTLKASIVTKDQQIKAVKTDIELILSVENSDAAEYKRICNGFEVVPETKIEFTNSQAESNLQQLEGCLATLQRFRAGLIEKFDYSLKSTPQFLSLQNNYRQLQSQAIELKNSSKEVPTKEDFIKKYTNFVKQRGQYYQDIEIVAERLNKLTDEEDLNPTYHIHARLFPPPLQIPPCSLEPYKDLAELRGTPAEEGKVIWPSNQL